MKFHRLFHSCETKNVGQFPQIHDGVIPTTWDDANYISNYLFRKATANVLIPKGVLAAKARQTDLLSASFAGFDSDLLVSDKLKKIIESFKNQGLQFLETEVIVQPKKEFKYWIVHPYDFGYEFLNLEHSSFVYLNSILTNNDTRSTTFASAGEIQATYKELHERVIRDPKNAEHLQISNIVLDENTPVDFFALRSIADGDIGYFVSATLRNEIERADCTGVVFKDLNENYP